MISILFLSGAVLILWIWLISFNLNIITFSIYGLFILEFFLLKYYKKHKDIFLGIIKREDISTTENKLKAENI